MADKNKRGAVAVPGELHYRAAVSGEVNGKPVALDGMGQINERTGLTDGRYNLTHISEAFSPGLLTACLITGYPNASSMPAGFTNPFSGGAYKYRRDLTFDTGDELSYDTFCELDSDGQLVSRFKMSGSVPLIDIPPEFQQSIEEEWEVCGPRTLRGGFIAKWIDNKGRSLTAQAQTRYVISALPTFEFEKLRRIIFLEYMLAGPNLHLRQRSSVDIECR